MVKVNLMTYNKNSYHDASWVEVSSLYLKWILGYGHLSISLISMGKLNFDALGNPWHTLKNSYNINVIATTITKLDIKNPIVIFYFLCVLVPTF